MFTLTVLFAYSVRSVKMNLGRAEPRTRLFDLASYEAQHDPGSFKEYAKGPLKAPCPGGPNFGKKNPKLQTSVSQKIFEVMSSYFYTNPFWI